MKTDPEAPPAPVDMEAEQRRRLRRLARTLRRRGVPLPKNAGKEEILAAAVASVQADPAQLIQLNELHRFVARHRSGAVSDPDGLMPRSPLDL